MRAVILAAGDGGRLGEHTLTVPKPLVPLNGRAIIDYTLDALAAVGVTELVVVTGYRERQLRAALERMLPATVLAQAPKSWTQEASRVSFVSNTRFRDGASLSLRAARPYCGDAPFLLVMSDHLLTTNLLVRLVAAGDGHDPRDCFIAADFSEHTAAYVEESTKVEVSAEGQVQAIGKSLGRWSALDTGAFLLSPAVWEAVDSVPEDCELSTIFTALAGRGLLRAADVSGEFWYDIDTSEDLAAAKTLLAASGE